MKLFFREFGQGDPLIIMHGLFGQSDNWVTLGKRFAQNFHVFIPDMRNHGQSPHAPLHSFPAMADDLLEFMDEHNLLQSNIIGHSMGGKAAMTFALEYSEMVNKLVVVDISPRQYPERAIHTKVLSIMMSMDLNKIQSRAEAETYIDSMLEDSRIRMFVMKNLYYKMQGQLAWRLNLEAINQSMDLLFDAINSDASFTGPTLFIKGGKSDYILPEDHKKISKLFPKASIENISGASHWVHADAPDLLYQLITDFLISR